MRHNKFSDMVIENYKTLSIVTELIMFYSILLHEFLFYFYLQTPRKLRNI